MSKIKYRVRVLNEDGARIMLDPDGRPMKAQDAVDELNRLTTALAELDSKTCVWKYDREDNKWDGGCGAAWTFIEGGIDENDMDFCPQCGGLIVTKTGEVEE